VIPEGVLGYDVKERIESIASSSQDLKTVKDKSRFVDDRLNLVNELFNDMVNGPNAVNLQTAVDTAKSSRGIDLEVQALMQALAHRKHLLRANQRNPEIYTRGQVLPTNTQEPIGWAVEVANQIYVESALPELKHEGHDDRPCVSGDGERGEGDGRQVKTTATGRPTADCKNYNTKGNSIDDSANVGCGTV